MFGVFFSDEPVVDLDGAMKSDTSLYAKYFHAMLDRGVYFAPSQFEAGFVSLAHTEADIDATLNAATEAFRLATLSTAT